MASVPAERVALQYEGSMVASLWRPSRTGPEPATSAEGLFCMQIWELPKRRGTLFWGPYNEDPII